MAIDKWKQLFGMDSDVSLGEQFSKRVYEPEQRKSTTPEKSWIPARTAGRLIEEVAELCLVLGEDPVKRVVDAVANEGRKAGVFPSELHGVGTMDEALVELGDCRVLLSFTAYTLGISERRVDEQASRKIDSMAEKSANGELIMVDGCLYRKIR